MYLWTTLDQVPADLAPTVVSIGNFDGVHAGHREVLAAVVAAAHEVPGRLAVAITFHPHPVHVLHPDRAPSLVMGRRDKLAALEVAGLDAVLDLEFTHELALQTPEEFVKGTIVDALHAAVFVVGHDIRFGYKNSGNLETLRELAGKYDFEVRLLDDVHGGLGGKEPERRWSSSWTRELLADGDVAGAAEILTRPHLMRGVVVHGDHRGTGLGFPTANLAPDSDGMVPADGVYAGWLTPSSGTEAGCRLPAAISIGTNPTFDGTQRRVEAYVLDRTDLELYDLEVVVEFVARLRPTLRFSGLEELIIQMNADVAQCREILEVAR